MRGRLVVVGLFAFTVLLGAPAFAQDTEGDGGLHVSGGGMIGTVGGSGSVSGTVRGPEGGGGASRPAPASVVKADPADQLNAVTDGDVKPATIAERPAQPLDATPIASSSSMPAMLLTVLIPSIVAAGVFYAIRRPRQI